MKQSLGLGTLYLMGAEVAFMISNYIIHILLARLLGVESYGVFGILMSLYLVNYAFLSSGIPKAVSKYLAEAKGNVQAIIKESWKAQLVLATFFMIIFVALSVPLARALHDPSLAPYIIFLGIMIFPLAFFGLYSGGYLNGLRLFKEQAIVKTIHPVLRMVFAAVFVIIAIRFFRSYALYGAFAGYFLALAVSIIACKYFLSRKMKKSKRDGDDLFTSNHASFSWKKMIKFAMPITLAALGFTLMRNVNVLFIKYFMDNASAGLYTAAFTLSNVTYTLFLVLSVTLMPSISHSVASNNHLLTKKYICEALRYLLLLLLPITALIAATAPEVMGLFFPQIYTQAALVLIVLTVAAVFLTISSVLHSIATGSGKPKVEMMITISGIIILAGLNIYFIPRWGIVGAAMSSALAAALMMCAAGTYVWHRFRMLLPLVSVIRILFASAVIFGIAYFWHFSGIFVGVTFALLLLAYFGLLWLLGEIREDDIRRGKGYLGILMQKVGKEG